MTSSPSPARPITRLLIANRGEIATRVLHAALESPTPIHITTLHTASDTSHTHHASQSLLLPSAASYLDIPYLISLAREHDIDTVHPGYGFLSESAEFARRMWKEVGVVVIGPGWETLRMTGDKVAARAVAKGCGVGVLAAMDTATGDAGDVKSWMARERVSWPIMLKAVDGGGGRGIRLVRGEEELDGQMRVAVVESPSGMVFAEKAALEGFRHIEVQIVGDGRDVRHLWERDCSIQRRYQKVVEIAPSLIGDVEFVQSIREAAVKMARSLRFTSLGTFEFLANPRTKEFYFLEVNPRLQVEHTITEQISGVDLVKVQLDIAQGMTLSQAIPSSLSHPTSHSIQLRITAENVQADWSLSVGRIVDFSFPSGNGIRLDTNLVHGYPAIVTADFDSLLAKLIITASSWEACVAKAKRALQDTRIAGVKTNLDILRGIVYSRDFLEGKCDTSWLEANFKTLLAEGVLLSADSMTDPFFAEAVTQSGPPLSASSTSSVLLRKGDAWSISLSPSGGSDDKSMTSQHHMKLLKVHRNELPSSLSAEILYTTPSTPSPEPMRLTLTSTTASSSSLLSAGKHRRGDAGNPAHVVIPFAGRLVDILVDEGDEVRARDAICVVRQMKMELEVRCQRAGRISWMMDIDEGEDVGEGTLACEIEEMPRSQDELRPKL